jgi:hypothetical protein
MLLKFGPLEGKVADKPGIWHETGTCSNAGLQHSRGEIARKGSVTGPLGAKLGRRNLSVFVLDQGRRSVMPCCEKPAWQATLAIKASGRGDSCRTKLTPHGVGLAATACAPSPFEASKPATWCEPRCQQARRPGTTVDVGFVAAARLTESTPSPANFSIARTVIVTPATALPPRPEKRGFQRARL